MTCQRLESRSIVVGPVILAPQGGNPLVQRVSFHGCVHVIFVLGPSKVRVGAGRIYLNFGRDASHSIYSGSTDLRRLLPYLETIFGPTVRATR